MEKYDVIIIGAGIGGLVCGCYLAKTGLKVLIIEKNAKPGGYCTSFERDGYNFDACVHTLCSYRKGGRLFNLFDDLGLHKRLQLKRYEPSDIIITPDHKINIFKDTYQTIEEFKKCFPTQRNSIKKFFRYIADTPTYDFVSLKDKTFKELLESYFTDKKLLSIIYTLMLQFTGLLPSELSAMVACLLWKEYVFDGGYYPKGGIQSFSDLLASRFTKFNGEIKLLKNVEKIAINKDRIEGIVLDDGNYITAKHIVSACDIKQTVFKLIGQNNVSKPVADKIVKARVSSSGFLVYLGIDKFYSEELSDLKANIYLIATYDINEIYSGVLKAKNAHLVITSPSIKDISLDKKRKLSLCLASNAIFRNESYWNENNKNTLADHLIKLSEQVLPNLSKHITLKVIATPLTLLKWTENDAGAAYGWASTPEQFGRIKFLEEFENLYIAGHWSNQGSGITSVVNSGYRVAEEILQKIDRLQRVK